MRHVALLGAQLRQLAADAIIGALAGLPLAVQAVVLAAQALILLLQQDRAGNGLLLEVARLLEAGLRL